MNPSRLYLEHYRSFELLDIELRPLTLLYGDNSAGKSAVLRLLPLLGDSFQGSGAPLDLRGPAAGGAAFGDLVNLAWRHASDRSLRLGLAWSDGLQVRWGVGSRPDPHQQERPTLLDVEVALGAARLQAFDPRSDAERLPGAVPLSTLRMQRLRPVAGDGLWGELGDRLEALVDRVAWLSPHRAPLPRFPPAAVFESSCLQADGADALAALALDVRLQTEVGGWLEAHCRRALELSPHQDSIRLSLSPLHNRALQVPLADAGLGVGRLITELVALALRRQPHRPDGARILCLEEPATHLHERLQVALGEHLAAIAAEPDPCTLVVETHSRALLAGVQLAIAQGRLSPDQVILHWVDQDEDGQSRVSTETFSRQGLPQGHRLAAAFVDQAHALSTVIDLALGG